MRVEVILRDGSVQVFRNVKDLEEYPTQLYITWKSIQDQTDYSTMIYKDCIRQYTYGP